MTLDEIIERHFNNLDGQYHIDEYIKWIYGLVDNHYFEREDIEKLYIEPYLKQETKWVRK